MSKISKYQKFETVTISRKDIKNAEYNPRKIGEKEAHSLRRSLKTHGLVETLVWNKRTGNLVGGHQRISQIDYLEKGTDYDLTVSAIDVDEKQEKEINIVLNNLSIQGEFDVESMTSLLKEVNIDNTFLTDYDLSIFGIDKNIEEAAKEQNDEDLEARIAAIKEAKQASKDKNVSQGENYVIVTFDSVEAKESFMDSIGFEVDDRYIKGEVLAKLAKAKK